MRWIFNFRGGERVAERRMPFRFGVVLEVGPGDPLSARAIVAWDEGTVSVEPFDALMRWVSPHVATSIEEINYLDRVAPRIIPPGQRKHDPFDVDALVAHRIDGRAGHVLGPPDHPALNDLPLTSVLWWNGPRRVETLPNWMLQDLLEYELEATDKEWRDLGREPAR